MLLHSEFRELLDLAAGADKKTRLSFRDDMSMLISSPKGKMAHGSTIVLQ